jgi:hypothetical protein
LKKDKNGLNKEQNRFSTTRKRTQERPPREKATLKNQTALKGVKSQRKPTLSTKPDK